MSKYYKAEDVISFLNTHCPKDMWEYQIADLPTIDIDDKGCGINNCRNCDVTWSSKICFERRGYTFDENGVPHKPKKG